MTRTFGIPEQYAAEILRAWRGHDSERLSANLARAAVLEMPGGPMEQEQAELLASVAVEMRGNAASGRVESEVVCLDLLRHLARPGAAAHTAH